VVPCRIALPYWLSLGSPTKLANQLTDLIAARELEIIGKDIVNIEVIELLA